MKSVSLSALLLLLSVLLAGCSDPAPPVEAVDTGQESGRLNDFFARAWELRLASSPELQSRVGSGPVSGLWDDLSPAAVDERQRRLRLQLVEMLGFSYPALDAAARLNYELFEEEVNRRIEHHRYRHHRYVVDPENGVHLAAPRFLIRHHAIADEQDALTYIQRLRGFGPLLDQAGQQLAVSKEAGVVPPRFVFDRVADDIRMLLRGRPFDPSGPDSVLLGDFKAKLELSPVPAERHADLVAAAGNALSEAVEPAYRRLATLLNDLAKQASGDGGAWSLPNGVQYYRAQVRWHTTTDLGPDEVHQLGQEAVNRLHESLRGLMPALAVIGSVSDLFRHMSRRADLHYQNNDAGRAAYIADAGRQFAAARERSAGLFRLNDASAVRLMRMESFIERSASRGVYEAPVPGESGAGRYFEDLSDMRLRPRYEVEALGCHAGWPGRHLQWSIAQKNEALPGFRRQFPATAFVEGWALYALALCKDLGAFQSPESEYGHLVRELMSAADAVVDTGLHAMQWAPGQAVRYYTDKTPLTRSEAARAVERILASPATAVAPWIGRVRFEQLKDRAAGEIGAAFDTGEFHRLLLQGGPLSFNALERIVNAYVASKAVATP